MSMESIVSIEDKTEQLMEPITNLNELLGDGWKEKCFFQSFEQAFTEKEIEAIKNRREVPFKEAFTETEIYSARLNEIFQKNNNNYKATVIENPYRKGEQELFLHGQIGKDKIFLNSSYSYNNDEKTYSLIPSRFGIVSEEGKVFDICPLLDNWKTDEVVYMSFKVKKEGKFDSGRQLSWVTKDGEYVRKTETGLPETYQELGIVVHELGHLFRKGHFKEKGLWDTLSSAHDQFEKICEIGSDYKPEGALTSYKVREIKASEERGSWAIGLSILKEAGKDVGIDCGSSKARQEILNRAEVALGTYNSTPYDVKQHLEQTPEIAVPGFTQKFRRGARIIRDQDLAKSVIDQVEKVTTIAKEE
jgi:hypothetical protein